MNPGENICKSYTKNVMCFTEIPLKFEFDGLIDDDCSFIFPQGYTVYIEEFILTDPGPDNFVLVGETKEKYRSKLKWEDRKQKSWKYLDEQNPLYQKSNPRSNKCIKTLKVI